jgi:hypothetical protein
VFKQIVTSGFVVIAMGGMSAMAQTAPPPADQQPSAGGGPPPGLAPPSGAPMGGKPSVKALKADCRARAKSQGLTAAAFQTSVQNCVGAQRPRAAARMACREQGKQQALSGSALTNFVKTCMSQPE